MTRKSEILFAILFFLSGAGIVSLLLLWRALLSAQTVVLFASLACPVLFLVASVVIFYRPRVAYGVGLAAAVLALGWLAWTEIAQSPWINSWILLNASDKYDTPAIPIGVVKISTTVLVLIGGFSMVFRLLPAGWVLRGRPVCDRTWPAIVLTALVMATWFVWGARPYREPIIVDGADPTLRILHVEKRGVRFHETSIGTWRDGRFWTSRDDRRLLQYQFQKDFAGGYMTLGIEQDVKALVQALNAETWSTQPPKALRSWNAEGWYVVSGERLGSLTFTTENGTAPPPDLVRVFGELDGLTPAPTQQRVTRDICLGFCYDPAAGLGFTAANQRCTYLQSGYTCR